MAYVGLPNRDLYTLKLFSASYTLKTVEMPPRVYLQKGVYLLNGFFSSGNNAILNCPH